MLRYRLAVERRRLQLVNFQSKVLFTVYVYVRKIFYHRLHVCVAVELTVAVSEWYCREYIL